MQSPFYPLDVLWALIKNATNRDAAATLRLLGKSPQGNPIRLITVGRGPLKAIVSAFSHPDEPVGGNSILYLLNWVLQNKDDERCRRIQWYLLPCVDPDFTRLNEYWFTESFSFKTYLFNRFRPARRFQVEWGFPSRSNDRSAFRYETSLLMKLIREVKPDLFSPLHNSLAGGAWFLVSDPCPELYHPLQEVCQSRNIPLEDELPEYAFMKRFARGVFSYTTTQEENLYNEEQHVPGSTPLGAISSVEYVTKNYDNFSITAEVPLWFIDYHFIQKTDLLDGIEKQADEMMHWLSMTWNEMEKKEIPKINREALNERVLKYHQIAIMIGNLRRLRNPSLKTLSLKTVQLQIVAAEALGELHYIIGHENAKTYINRGTKLKLVNKIQTLCEGLEPYLIPAWEKKESIIAAQIEPILLAADWICNQKGS